MVWCGVVWCGVVCCGMVWYGMAWHGMAWHGMAWHGMAWHGTVWYGKKIFYACTIRTKSDQLRHDSLQLSPILSGNYLSMKIYTHKLGRFKQQNITNFCKKQDTKDLG